LVCDWGSSERCEVAALELRRKIPVDFQADADLDERRSAPSHFRLLKAFYGVKLPVFLPKAKPLN